MFSRKSQKLNFVLLVLILSSIFFAIPLVYGAEYVAVPSSDGESGNKGNLTGPAAAVVTVLAWIIYPFAYAAGLLLTFLIWMFIEVIQYNHFIDVDTVIKGWVIIRDLCNMFFVLILLTIAFATILRVESYQLKKILPKLIIAAVLINFSRTIFGLIIDFGQVVMMTFVSGFAQFGANEFVKAFQINEYLSFANTHVSTEGVGVLATLGALIAGFAALLITLVVVIVFLAIIIMRIIMLWVYTILSPLVFLGHAFPAAQKYTQQIWSDFIKQVVTGPLLAFFVWLALTTAQPSAQELQNSWAGYNPFGSGNANFQDQLQQERSKVSGALSSIFTANNFQRYIIVIALLIGGLMVTQQMGGFAGQMAGKGMGWIQSGKGLGMKGLKTGADWLNRMQWEGGALKRFGWKGTGVDLNLKRGWGTLTGKMEDMKKKQIASGVQRSKEVMDTRGRMWGTLAMTGNAGDAWEQITTLKGFSQRFLQGTRGGIFGTGGGKGLVLKRAKLDAELGEKDANNEWKDSNSLLARREKVWKKSEHEKHEKDLTDMKKQSITLEDSINKAKKEKDDLSATQEQRQAVKEKLDKLVKEQVDLKSMIKHKEKFIETQKVDDEETKELDAAIKEKKRARAETAPMYQFEAIASDNKAVQEEIGRLKDIDDADELVRILKDAIGQKDKTRIKALVKKLTEDYNDNEYLEALVPRTGSGYEGMQQFMRALSGQLNEKDLSYEKEYVDHLRSLNAGFNKDEAFTLGAQVAEMNKRTNHWENAASYVMEDGKYREATEKEHTLIASAEFGKKSPQANMRDNNRLAYGKHWYDEEGNKHYDVTKIGQIMIQSFDVQKMIGRLPENMTESAAKFIKDAALKMDKEGLLTGADGIKKLAQSIAEKAHAAKAGEEGFNEQYNRLLANITTV